VVTDPPHLVDLGVRFSFPKNPKVDVPMFNGNGGVLNSLYQMEHLCAIHETPMEERVEFCVFYLRDDALVWWRWVQKQKGCVPVLNSMRKW